MKFNDTHSFDEPSDTVIKMFTDPAYFTDKYAALGFSNIKVIKQSQDGDDFSITVQYEAPSDAPVPGFAKKFMAETNVVTQTDSWNRASKTGRLDAEIKGLPAKIGADMKLVDAGGGCRNELSWNISCSIPLVGGKVEKLIAQDIQSKAQADQDQTAAMLANY